MTSSEVSVVADKSFDRSAVLRSSLPLLIVVVLRGVVT